MYFLVAGRWTYNRACVCVCVCEGGGGGGDKGTLTVQEVPFPEARGSLSAEVNGTEVPSAEASGELISGS